MKKMLILLCATSLLQPLFAQQATVTETVETVKTYPFSDPDPVADPSDLFYPYFRFDGFSAKGTDRQLYQTDPLPRDRWKDLGSRR